MSSHLIFSDHGKVTDWELAEGNMFKGENLSSLLRSMVAEGKVVDLAVKLPESGKDAVIMINPGSFSWWTVADVESDVQVF